MTAKRFGKLPLVNRRKILNIVVNLGKYELVVRTSRKSMERVLDRI